MAAYCRSNRVNHAPATWLHPSPLPSFPCPVSQPVGTEVSERITNTQRLLDKRQDVLISTPNRLLGFVLFNASLLRMSDCFSTPKPCSLTIFSDIFFVLRSCFYPSNYESFSLSVFLLLSPSLSFTHTHFLILSYFNFQFFSFRWALLHHRVC